MVFPEIAGQASRHAAHPALQEDVGESPSPATLCTCLLHDLFGNGAIALHHIAWNVLVAVVRGVGNHLPAVGCCEARGLMHRFIVIAGNAHDVRAIGGNGLLPFGADVGVQHDDAAAPGVLGCGSQAPSVVAVGGADHGVATQRFCIPAGEDGGRFKVGVQPQDLTHQGDGSAQRLEAAQR